MARASLDALARSRRATQVGGSSYRQCTAKSKRSGQRCRGLACRGKSVCKNHGGIDRERARRRMGTPRLIGNRVAAEERTYGRRLVEQWAEARRTLAAEPLARVEGAMEHLGDGDGPKALYWALRALCEVEAGAVSRRTERLSRGPLLRIGRRAAAAGMHQTE